MTDQPHSMASASKPPPTWPAMGWIPFLAHFLFVLAAWTITIKYLFPIGYAAAAGQPLLSHVSWDLWPIAHAWLGWALLRWPWYTGYLAIGMALAEIAIVLTLLSRFLAEPDWTIWNTNWFINKLFVLLCFVLILATFTLARRTLARYREALNQSRP